MKGGVNIDTKSLMFKLQKALKTKGKIICINTNQFYSKEQNRFIRVSSIPYILAFSFNGLSPLWYFLDLFLKSFIFASPKYF